MVKTRAREANMVLAMPGTAKRGPWEKICLKSQWFLCCRVLERGAVRLVIS